MNAASEGHRSMKQEPTSARAVLAGSIGNVVEWYDYAIYGYLATAISDVFFAHGSTALLLTFATFGVGFVMRPVGSIVFGHIGDAKGRKFALVLTLVLMGSATVLIGLIPTYGAIGFAAPVLLVVLRLIQGFAAGGEWGGSTAFVVEYAAKNKRGFIGSWQQSSVIGGLLIGAIVGTALTASLSEDALLSWGWRIPFLAGVIVLGFGAYLRFRLRDTPRYEASEAVGEVSKHPLSDMLRAHRGGLWRVFGLTVVWTVGFYLFFTYLPTYLETEVGLSKTFSLSATILELALAAASVPVFGALSDRIGRKPLLLLGTSLFVIVPVPIFVALSSGSATLAIILAILGALMNALLSGPGPAAISELFPTKVRYSALSIPYSFAVAIFGGFAPFIATLLIEVTGQSIAPTYYIVAAGIVSFVTVCTFRESSHDSLR